MPKTRCELIENSHFGRTSPEGEQQVSKHPCHGTSSPRESPPRDRTNRTAMYGPNLPAERQECRDTRTSVRDEARINGA